MNVPKQARPVERQTSSRGSSEGKIRPLGKNTQCCGPKDENCMTKFCAIGLQSSGCDHGQPYIHCLSP